jgi:hypothetical protein
MAMFYACIQEHAFRIYARLPDIPNEIRHGFPQFLQVNTRKVLQTGHDNSFPKTPLLNIHGNLPI